MSTSPQSRAFLDRKIAEQGKATNHRYKLAAIPLAVGSVAAVVMYVRYPYLPIVQYLALPALLVLMVLYGVAVAYLYTQRPVSQKTFINVLAVCAAAFATIFSVMWFALVILSPGTVTIANF